MLKTLTIVVPCYNEEEVLPETVKEIGTIIEDLIAQAKISTKSKILFVNDGSKDRTWELIEEEHKAHPVQVCGVKLASTPTFRGLSLPVTMVTKTPY